MPLILLQPETKKQLIDREEKQAYPDCSHQMTFRWCFLYLSYSQVLYICEPLQAVVSTV
jgi:hypothetical protein